MRCRAVAGTVAEELGAGAGAGRLTISISSVTSAEPGASRVTPSLSASLRVFGPTCENCAMRSRSVRYGDASIGLCPSQEQSVRRNRQLV